MKVVIDAGHGKETAGKRSFDNSFFEYEFNRDVSKRIKYHLERHDVQVILTALTDKDVSLGERCKISNKEKPDCFVSIHANAFGTKWNDANGWEIFVVGKGGNAEKIAKYIHEESKDLGLKDRGTKVDSFYVLKHTDAPAVLIEHGFYTNKTELVKLKDDLFREKCAITDTKGILKYLGIVWREEKSADNILLDFAVEYNLIDKKDGINLDSACSLRESLFFCKKILDQIGE